MLIEFKSQFSSNVVMLEPSGKQILGLLGKDPGAERGIVTVEQLPAAIATLTAEIARDKAASAEPRQPKTDEDITGEPTVRLFQRALPVLELLQSAAEHAAPVTWGV